MAPLLVRVAAFGCALVLVVPACGGNSRSSPTPVNSSGPPQEETATHAPNTAPPPATATATEAPPWVPDELAGIPVNELALATAGTLPRDVVVYFQAGRYQSHSLPNTLYRTYTASSGEERTIDLFATLPKPGGNSPGVYSWAASDRMGEIVAAVCDLNSCGVGVQAPSAGAPLQVSCTICADQKALIGDGRIFRSTDGGITWAEVGTLPAGRQFSGWRDGEAVVLVPGVKLDGSDPIRFETWPSGRPVLPPRDRLVIAAVGATLTWYDEDEQSYIDDKGAVLFRKSLRDSQTWIGAAGTSRFSAWTKHATNLSFLLRSAADGRPTEAWALLAPGLWDAQLLNENIVLSTMGIGDSDWETVFIDLERGTMTPLPVFGLTVDAGGQGNGPILRRANLGVFVEVTGTSSCLNLRRQPEASAEVRACYPDGVLLNTYGDDRQNPGWVGATGPDGLQGWVRREFVND